MSNTNESKYTLVQSLWTKPMRDKAKLRETLYITALSLAYAHQSGYKVNMHTDGYGHELLKDFGYDNLFTTLDEIPEKTPTDLFAAGKFFAMRKEGLVGKIHTDVDVFIRKPHLLDKFYEDKRIDLICQQEEDYAVMCNHDKKIRSIHALGYPPATRPNWRGSINVGIVGFNNLELAKKYSDNYFEALDMYSQELFDEYKKKDKDASLQFDFILEQISLSYFSIGHNVYALLPSDMNNVTFVADMLGYVHIMGISKWKKETIDRVHSLLESVDNDKFRLVRSMIL